MDPGATGLAMTQCVKVGIVTLENISRHGSGIGLNSHNVQYIVAMLA